MRSLIVLTALALAARQPASPTTASTAEATTTPETIATTTVDCTSATPSGPTQPPILCDGGKYFTVQYDAGSTCAIVTAGGQTYRVPAALAASGERYQGGGVEYWAHNGEAMLEGAAGGPYAKCSTLAE